MSRLLLGGLVAAGLLLASAPAAAAEGNPSCGTNFQPPNGAYATCARMAYGEKVRVGLLCIDSSGNPYTRYGPWVNRPGQTSLKYCDIREHRLDATWPDVVIETR